MVFNLKGKVYFRNGIHHDQINEDIKERTLLKIFWQFPTNKKSISQEILVFDWKYLMASVGGTLGLFIGFSVFDMFSIIIDTIFNRIYAKNEWSLINMDVILSNTFNFLHKDLILELITLSKQSRDNSQLLNISSEKTTITISKLLSYYSFEKSSKCQY